MQKRRLSFSELHRHEISSQRAVKAEAAIKKAAADAKLAAKNAAKSAAKNTVKNAARARTAAAVASNIGKKRSKSKKKQARQELLFEESEFDRNQPVRTVGPAHNPTQVTLNVQHVMDDLKCGLCLNPYSNPVFVPFCMHRFCSGCISQHISAGGKECPVCRSECKTKRSLREDASLEKFVRLLRPSFVRSEDNIQAQILAQAMQNVAHLELAESHQMALVANEMKVRLDIKKAQVQKRKEGQKRKNAQLKRLQKRQQELLLQQRKKEEQEAAERARHEAAVSERRVRDRESRSHFSAEYAEALAVADAADAAAAAALRLTHRAERAAQRKEARSQALFEQSQKAAVKAASRSRSKKRKQVDVMSEESSSAASSVKQRRVAGRFSSRNKSKVKPFYAEQLWLSSDSESLSAPSEPCSPPVKKETKPEKRAKKTKTVVPAPASPKPVSPPKQVPKAKPKRSRKRSKGKTVAFRLYWSHLPVQTLRVPSEFNLHNVVSYIMKVSDITESLLEECNLEFRIVAEAGENHAVALSAYAQGLGTTCKALNVSPNIGSVGIAPLALRVRLVPVDEPKSNNLYVIKNLR
jgi:hypothetical protein